MIENPKLQRGHLQRAKAFLCWDKFPMLSIQLVPIKGQVGYFFPPRHDYSQIVLFYSDHNDEFSDAIFLLFHEIGHYIQYNHYAEVGQSSEFSLLVEKDKGPQKMAFEKESWQLGSQVLIEFLGKEKIAAEGVLLAFNRFAEKSILTYSD